MGFLDSIEGMATQALGANSEHSGVGGSFIQSVQEHPGGLGAVLDSFRNNGMASHADQMQNGQAPPMSPDQVQTGLQGTGLLESTAARMGISPEVAKIGLAVALPLILSHMSRG